MTEVVIVSADLSHAAELAIAMRAADVAEVHAETGRGVLDVLVESLEISSEVWAVYFAGELACVWGVAQHAQSQAVGDLGVGWMLTTEAVERHAKTFWKLCRQLLPWVLTRWGVLVNAIDVRHDKALRWARRLGFRLEEPAPFGAQGLDFCRFAVTKGDLRV